MKIEVKNIVMESGHVYLLTLKEQLQSYYKSQQHRFCILKDKRPKQGIVTNSVPLVTIHSLAVLIFCQVEH